MTIYKIIEEAICSKRIIEISYHGTVRIVEPHLLGVTTGGNVALSAFQTIAPSGTGFRLFILDEISEAMATEEFFKEPRRGFNPNDKTMREVLLAI